MYNRTENLRGCYDAAGTNISNNTSEGDSTVRGYLGFVFWPHRGMEFRRFANVTSRSAAEAFMKTNLNPASVYLGTTNFSGFMGGCESFLKLECSGTLVMMDQLDGRLETYNKKESAVESVGTKSYLCVASLLTLVPAFAIVRAPTSSAASIFIKKNLPANASYAATLDLGKLVEGFREMIKTGAPSLVMIN